MPFPFASEIHTNGRERWSCKEGQLSDNIRVLREEKGPPAEEWL